MRRIHATAIWIVRGMYMRIDLLASGSKGNACLVRDGTTCILIDCGSTKKYLFSALAKVGADPDEIDAVLITHDHADHVSQIRHFADHTIYSPVEIPDIETLHVQAMKPFVIETLKITPIALSHDAPHTTGYIFENGSEKLVYVTDTGYVSERYFALMKGADTVIMESNHDVGMLMRTRRPHYVKARIYSDEGHLCNEDCAAVLDAVTTENTKTIFLAHLSQEGNTREKALAVSSDLLLAHHHDLNRRLVVAAAGQFEILTRGDTDEEMDYGTVYRAVGMECGTDLCPDQKNNI